MEKTFADQQTLKVEPHRHGATLWVFPHSSIPAPQQPGGRTGGTSYELDRPKLAFLLQALEAAAPEALEAAT